MTSTQSSLGRKTERCRSPKSCVKTVTGPRYLGRNPPNTQVEEMIWHEGLLSKNTGCTQTVG